MQPKDYLALKGRLEYIRIDGNAKILLPADKDRIGEWAGIGDVMLGFGFDSETALSIAQSDLSIRGLAVHGAHEVKTGINDFDELAGILESLEE